VKYTHILPLAIGLESGRSFYIEMYQSVYIIFVVQLIIMNDFFSDLAILFHIKCYSIMYRYIYCSNDFVWWSS
jgi:hypothetical protein